MGADQASDPARQAWRPKTHGGRARDRQWHHVCAQPGCQWRYVPKDLPPRSTLHDYLDRWSYDGTLEQIHHALYVMSREQVAREASPSACVIDSQSVKGAEKGGAASIRLAMIQAKRSRARSGISWSTR